MALSRASGPVEQGAGDLARSAILQRAAASSVEGTFGLTVSTAERIGDPHRLDAEGVREVDRILRDVAFLRERRRDVDRGVGHDEGRGMLRHVHDEDSG